MFSPDYCLSVRVTTGTPHEGFSQIIETINRECASVKSLCRIYTLRVPNLPVLAISEVAKSFRTGNFLNGQIFLYWLFLKGPNLLVLEICEVVNLLYILRT